MHTYTYMYYNHDLLIWYKFVNTRSLQNSNKIMRRGRWRFLLKVSYKNNNCMKWDEWTPHWRCVLFLFVLPNMFSIYVITRTRKCCGSTTLWFFCLYSQFIIHKVKMHNVLIIHTCMRKWRLKGVLWILANKTAWWKSCSLFYHLFCIF